MRNVERQYLLKLDTAAEAVGRQALGRGGVDLVEQTGTDLQ